MVVEVEVITTVDRNTLGTQVVIVGYIVFVSHMNTIVKPAQPGSTYKKRNQNNMTPWEVSDGMRIISLNVIAWGSTMIKLI